MLTVFGIRNCDTCRHALKWLAAEEIPHVFHDLRKEELDRGSIAALAAAVGWERLLNRRGTTWRKLPDAGKNPIDKDRAIDLMQSNPTLMKRPIFKDRADVFVGFDGDVRDAISRLRR